MIRLIALTSILVAWASLLHAQVQLPDLYTYNYAMSRRDPFISANAPNTIMNEYQEPRGIVSGDVVSRYLESIVQLIKTQLYVGGISIGDTPVDSIALINGVDFHVGDKVPLDAARKDLQGLQQLAATYGLPLVTDQQGSFVVEVGRVTENGVDLVLPGFKAAIYHLPLPDDGASEVIRLEKKKKKPRLSN
jgi:hypothetical protein